MNEKEFENLKEEKAIAFQEKKDALNNFKKTVLSQPKINLPDGFDLRVYIDSRSKLSGLKVDEVKIYVDNVDKKDNKGKYFWTLDAKTELEYIDKLVDYKLTTADGGFNGNYYGDKNEQEIDPIERTELSIKINIAQLNILKIAKNQPEVFMAPLNVYRIASEKLENLNNQYTKELLDRNEVERKENLDIIKENFNIIGSKTVEKLKNQLKNNDASESSVSVVLMDLNPMSYSDTINVKKCEIICKKGSNTTYAIKEGALKSRTIKAADIDTYLSKGLVFDGKRSESISEFLSQLSEKVEVSDNFKLEKNIKIEKLAEIAKTLNKKTNDLEIKSTGSRNKLI